MIVADTSAIIALIDADDRHHDVMLGLYQDAPEDWVLPWAVLPEIDFLLLRHVGARVERAFVRDIATGAYLVEWGEHRDLVRARALSSKYGSLQLGLVDAVVVAVAERLRARAIATLDLRDFGALRIEGSPKIVPRDR